MKITTKPTLAESLLSDILGGTFPFTSQLLPYVDSPAYGRGSVITGDTVRFNSTADTFTTEIDLPGVKKADLNVEVSNNHVYINAKRTITTTSGKKEETLTRSFSLDKDADVDTLSATQEDGVLIITAKRKNVEKSRIKTLKIQ